LLNLKKTSFINCQNGKLRAEVPMNSTFWAPFDAHNPDLLQEIILGMTLTAAEKVDTSFAKNTKFCK